MSIPTKLFLFSFIAFGLTCCNNSTPEALNINEDFKEIIVENTYALMVPKYMSESMELHEEASLQLLNKRRETYVLAINESKEDFIYSFKELNSYNDSWSVIENYATVSIMTIEKSTGLTVGEPKITQINGMNARLYKMEGQIEGISADISYILAYIEGEKSVYSITTWTLKSRMNKYKNTFFQVIKSFHELENEQN